MRLLALWITGTALDTAICLGLGWASAEILYVIVNGVVLAYVRQSQRIARIGGQQLEQDLSTRKGLLLGIIERLSATTFHVGASLMVAAFPLLVLVTIPIHSSLNLLPVFLPRRSLGTTEFIIAVLSTLVLILGLSLHNAF
jgi:hypothetical protein